jgi:DNA-binding transcriptional regulator YhcF (GntR family)
MGFISRFKENQRHKKEMEQIEMARWRLDLLKAQIALMKSMGMSEKDMLDIVSERLKDINKCF